MDLKEVASISGKGGLFRIVKPTRTGVIIESLDGKGGRIVATANHRISVLKEISIYTTDAEGSRPLEEVLQEIHKEFGDDPGVDSSSSPEELRAFLQHVLPDFDRERVYISDIKKLVSWYKLLLQYAPESLVTREAAKTEEEKEEATSPSSEEKPVAEDKKPSSKKEKKEKA